MIIDKLDKEINKSIDKSIYKEDTIALVDEYDSIHIYIKYTDLDMNMLSGRLEILDATLSSLIKNYFSSKSVIKIIDKIMTKYGVDVKSIV